MRMADHAEGGAAMVGRFLDQDFNVADGSGNHEMRGLRRHKTHDDL